MVRLASRFLAFWALALAVNGATISMEVVSGSSLVWSLPSGAWSVVAQNAVLGFGDSVFVDDGHEITLLAGEGITLRLKGPGRMVLTGEQIDLTVGLLEGQLFLRREHPYEMRSLVITAAGCYFIPQGTAGAIKFTRSGEPTVAMIEGEMRMEAPSGEAIVVEAGRFATLDKESGSLTVGELHPDAIAMLQAWGGSASGEADEAQSAAAPSDEPGEPGVDAPPVDQLPASPEHPAEQFEPVGQEPAAPAPVPEEGGVPEHAAEKEDAAEVGDDAGVGDESVKGAAPPDERRRRGERPAPPPGDAVRAGADGQERGEEPAGEAPEGEPDARAEKPVWGLSAGPVTVDGEQWTRIAFFGDIPIWKFGLGIDVELFMNAQGEFDNKGWDFTRDYWVESLTRKIVYLRFQREPDPVYIKFGGLDNVTLGYGFVMDRFTNMLRYPDEKQLGLQFYLNDLGPIGFTLQTVVADFHDFRREGGVGGVRGGLRPLKAAQLPLVSRLQIAATYVLDRNQYAPARQWDFTLRGGMWDRDEDGVTDSTYLYETYGDLDFYDELVEHHKDIGDYDRVVEHADAWASRRRDGFAVFGLDASMPIISTSLLNLTLYAQYAMSMDVEGDDDTVTTEGWGIGAPGVAATVGPLWARLEYRHINGAFSPGYFGTYYDYDRLWRSPISTKESRLIDEQFNGVYGTGGLNIRDMVTISGQYQYLIPRSQDIRPDQRYEARAGVGSVIIEKIPKINRAEAFVHKTNVGEQGDALFEKSVHMYWGYRLGFEIMPGAGIVWESRYGWEYDENGRLQENNNIGIQASLTF